MKNKSTKHKEENRFKFERFSERIANIDIDVFHRISYADNHFDEAQCYFQQELEKWEVLNLSEGYHAFQRDVKPQTVVTLAQLLHERERVVEVLIKHLKLKNILSLQPLLELSVALVKDLRSDFYQYFCEFYNVVLDLLNTKDTNQLEWTFTTLAYIFKILWRVLVKDFDKIFISLLPLLSDKKPAYIRNFASESFAFVARRIKDRKSFLLLILSCVEQYPNGVKGCAQLIFEVLHGVNNQFHSCAESYLLFILEFFSDEEINKKVYYKIVEELVKIICMEICHKKDDLFWKATINTLAKFVGMQHCKKNEAVINNVILLCGLALEMQGAKFIPEPVCLLKLIIQFLEKPLSMDTLSNMLNIALLFLSCNIKLPQHKAWSLVSAVLGVKQKPALLHFVSKSNKLSVFDSMIFPKFITMCIEDNLNDTLSVLSAVIASKAEICYDGLKYHNWTKYPININSEKGMAIEDRLFKLIKLPQLEESSTAYIYLMICLPHFTKVDEQLKARVTKNILTLCNDISLIERNEIKWLKFKLFLLNITVQCAVHLNENQDVFAETVVNSISEFCTDIAFIPALKTVNLLLSAKQLKVDLILLERLNNFLGINFSSPYHEIRNLTAHIFAMFEHNFDVAGPDVENFSVFSICRSVESTDAQIDTYRNQLHLLDKFSADKSQMQLCKSTAFEYIPLRYLCGVLYMNFKLLWEPVQKLIATHAVAMDTNAFWIIFGEQLKKAVHDIKSTQDSVSVLLPGEVQHFMDECYNVTSRPDFHNYRILLWQAMDYFPDVAEAKTRCVSELFLDFYKNEYVGQNPTLAQFLNIEVNTNDEQDDTLTLEEAVDDDTMETLQNNPKEVEHMNGKTILRCLMQHLSLFTKIRSPRSMYKESELYNIYFDLLSHRNEDVQKLAINCICCYKFPFIQPYAQNLLNLIDKKHYKHELATFRVDEDSNLILQEHRAALIPIVMSIVFSKMRSMSGQGITYNRNDRRNMVVRFLSGCADSEKMNFVQISFKYYVDHLHSSDIAKTIKNVSSNVDLKKFSPPKRLISGIDLINTFLDSGGLLHNELISFLLEILLIISAIIQGAYDLRVRIHSGYFNSLRYLKNIATKTMARFFQQFHNFSWSTEQLDAVFSTTVWPYLESLSSECVQKPTSLFKLINYWGSNARYFCLLSKVGPHGKSVLPEVIRLLENDKCDTVVTNMIFEMVQCLLTLEPDIETDVPLPYQSDFTKTHNYGSEVLLPYIHFVLSKYHKKLSNKSCHINNRDLSILSRLTEFVTGHTLANDLLTLFLPITRRKCNGIISEELTIQLISTLINLIRNCDTPDHYLREIAPLFGSVKYPICRKMLCDLLKTIARNAQITSDYETVYLLNAYEAKWIDQPDFESRLNGFKQINTEILKNSLQLEQGIIIIYCCAHMIMSESDTAMRDNSSTSLKSLAKHIIDAYPEEVRYIVDDTLLTIIRGGLNIKSINIRNEFITLLGHLARTCSTAHLVLEDLHKLCKADDLEVDFFENLVHLQIHRHGRALNKFSQMFSTESYVMAPRTLTQFVLPLTTHYLLNESFAGKNSIIDAAIEAIGVICTMLPWHQYEGLLTYYLQKLKYKLEFQKQLIRLIITILDGFHFDISHTTATDIPIVSDPPESSDQSAVQREENDHEDCNDLTSYMDTVENVVGTGNEENTSKRNSALSKSAVKRIIRAIKTKLLPQLTRTLGEMSSYESVHKVNRKLKSNEREEDELLRVPISLALIKLLQKLPKQILDESVPGILMKLSSFLKSKLESVRRVTREMLQLIMTTLGTDYLPVLLNIITPLLSRGFQSHVLVYTVHAIFVSLKQHFKHGDVDKVMKLVENLCIADLFGVLAEEKEIVKIGTKTSEAKSSKSVDTFQIIATFISSDSLMDLIMPLKEILLNTQSAKVALKVDMCLRVIATGLAENALLDTEALLQFSYGIASESIPQLLPEERQPLSEKESVSLVRFPESSLILPKAPRRQSSSISTKISVKSNSSALVEFGLRLCYILLKREKLKNSGYNGYLDPFVPIFVKCLDSSHVKLCTIAIQIIGQAVKFDLPSMRTFHDEIIKSIFAILHKFAAAGLTKGDNFDLVVATFKTVTILLRSVSAKSVSPQQLTLLVMYAEQDLHNAYDRQSTAFQILRALLLHIKQHRHSSLLKLPQLHEVVGVKVAEMSIRSEVVHVRSQARSVIQQYMLDYPLSKLELDRMFNWYIKQLDYELETGRLLAIEIIDSLINSFPENMLKQYASVILVSLGSRLINDESPQCRQNIAVSITTMFQKLGADEVDQLFDMILLWLRDRKDLTRQLAAQLLGLMTVLEGVKFERRLKLLSPVLLNAFGAGANKLASGSFVRCNQNLQAIDNEKTRANDHCLYQILLLLHKLATYCPNFMTDINLVEQLSRRAQSLLSHGHDWVRFGAAKFLGYALATIDTKDVIQALKTNASGEGYLLTNPRANIRSLSLDLIDQLQPGNHLRPEFAEQVVKNLIFVARVVQHERNDISTSKEPTTNLFQLVKRLRGVVQKEIIECPQVIDLRIAYFKWIAGVCSALDLAPLQSILNHLVAPLVREMSSEDDDRSQDGSKEIRQMAIAVSKMLQQRIGPEEYSSVVSEAQSRLLVRRAERKRGRTQLAATDPEKFAQRKIRGQQKKKELRKRKIALHKDGLNAPRKKRRIVSD